MAAPHSLNTFVSCVLPLLFGFANDDPEKFEEPDSDPPQKGGFLLTAIAASLWQASIPARRGSLSSVFIPAGRLGTAPRRGAKEVGFRMASELNSFQGQPVVESRQVVRQRLADNPGSIAVDFQSNLSGLDARRARP